MSTSDVAKTEDGVKVPEATTYYSSSTHDGEVITKWQNLKSDLKQTFLTREGWIGDYVCLPRPAILPLSRTDGSRTICTS